MIQITADALKQIQTLKRDGGLGESAKLRVRVARGGCSGFSYKLDFDQQTNADDKVISSNGEEIIIDSQSYLYVVGMTLDYSGGLNGRGFVFVNPNATKTCGCGSSFAV